VNLIDEQLAQTNASTGYYVPSSGGLANAEKIQSGISSALKELAAEVSEACNTADNLKSTLGISSPEQGTKNGQETGTMLGFLRNLTFRLRESNGRLADCLRHLDS
jgi:hypothetical protein